MNIKKLLSILTLSGVLACSVTPSFAQLPSMVEGRELPSLAPMLERITPAVVNISTKTRTRTANSPLLNDPFFRFFFDLPTEPRERTEQSLGSGVIIDARRGHVITNHHVIDKADEILVTLRDGRKLKAELIGSDKDTDVALIKIPTENLTQIPLMDSDRLRVGDFVVAIGNPFGLGQTVTSGIVSALGRSGLSIQGYEDFIQTDASINPGNSGGALVNLRGELIGINTAIIAPSGGNIGIGFAIPTNMAMQVISHLAEYGEVRRGTVGIAVQDLNPDLAKAFNLNNGKGAVIVNVERDSPAERAGIKVSDVVLEVNDQPIHSATDLRNRLGLARVGDHVKLSLIRNGNPINIRVKISDNPSISGSEVSRYLEGAKLVDDDGVIVKEVERRSAAERVGLQKGDKIIGFNRRKIDSLNALTEALRQRRGFFSLQIEREGDVFSVTLQ